MRISEITSDNQKYHEMDIQVSRFVNIHKNIHESIIDLRADKKESIRQGRYANWVAYLNILDTYIHEFIILAIHVRQLVSYFEKMNRNYFPEKYIVSVTDEIVKLRKTLN